ncbi:MAG: DUF1501 domain-containing protein [Lentisphaeraceae bacterium]|nr:DUF1501 domain-containing protein [Lentisphaeraceae bacterium]
MINFNRRSFLKAGAASLGGLALPGFADQDQLTHFAPKAKSVIFLHMVGAPSQLDLFDYKPVLNKWHDKNAPEKFYKGKKFAFITGIPKMMGSPFKFKQQGQSGQWMSELLPNMSKVVDDMAFVRSLHTKEFNHAPAQLALHTGLNRQGNPSMGSWLSYGLKSNNKNLPPYVVMVSGKMPGAGAQLWNNGFLPSVHQGIEFRSEGDPVLFLSDPKGMSREHRRDIVSDINALNHQSYRKSKDAEALTRISQYELAYRMQQSVPDLADLKSEPKHVRDIYGKGLFARHCLQARRLVEKGVRCVELFNEGWDTHGDIKGRLTKKCKEVDQAVCALILDLKQRGLLDETLIVWGAEFGRTPMSQATGAGASKGKPGRDHHKDAFTMWMAGGGIKGGVSYGSTDEFGYHVHEKPTEIRDIHATIMHQLGLNHEQVTYRYMGLDQRLTGVEEAHVLKDILA